MWCVGKTHGGKREEYNAYDVGCGCCSVSYSFDFDKKKMRKTALREIEEVIEDLEQNLEEAKMIKRKILERQQDET